jgi:inner membrane protein
VVGRWRGPATCLLLCDPTVFALGHLGLGKRLAARPFRRFSAGERRAFFLGALLPDLIDKPLFYIPFWLTAGRSAKGALSGTHLFAHTAVFLLALVLVALIRRSPVLRAVAIGVTTHFLLDCVGLSMGLGTLLWPFLGWRFPAYPFKGLGHHLTTILNPVTLAGELAGAAVLLWDYQRQRGKISRRCSAAREIGNSAQTGAK